MPRASTVALQRLLTYVGHYEREPEPDSPGAAVARDLAYFEAFLYAVLDYRDKVEPGAHEGRLVLRSPSESRVRWGLDLKV